MAAAEMVAVVRKNCRLDRLEFIGRALLGHCLNFNRILRQIKRILMRVAGLGGGVVGQPRRFALPMIRHDKIVCRLLWIQANCAQSVTTTGMFGS